MGDDSFVRDDRFLHDDEPLVFELAEKSPWKVRSIVNICVFLVNCLLLLVFYSFFLYGSIVNVFQIEEYLQPFYLLQPLSLLLFVLLHSVVHLGWLNALLFALVTIIGSWTAEEVGVWTGWLFGKYSYTQYSPVHVSYVPIEVPFCWYMMLYLTFCISDAIVNGRMSLRLRNGWASVLLVPLFGALMMVGWDMAADPMSSTVSSLWIWEQNGSYFGVPLWNYGGWLLVSYALLFVCALIDKFVRFGVVLHHSLLNAALPFVAFFGLFLVYFVWAEPVEITLIVCMSMLLPWLIGLTRLVCANLDSIQAVEWNRLHKYF